MNTYSFPFLSFNDIVCVLMLYVTVQTSMVYRKIIQIGNQSHIGEINPCCKQSQNTTNPFTYKPWFLCIVTNDVTSVN